MEIGTASLPDERHPEKNEDAVLVDRKSLLFGVFDGLGGHNAGEVASRAAKEFIEKWADEIEPDMSAEEAADALGQILEDANDYIFAMSKKPEYMDMGSTAAVVKLLESRGKIMAVVGHVGDSRVYRLSPEGKLQELLWTTVRYEISFTTSVRRGKRRAN